MARRAWTANNAPVPRDHFVDVVIPRRLWSAFKPEFGRRTITRAPDEGERRVLVRRASDLASALLPYQRPEENDRVTAAIDGCLASFPTHRLVNDALVARLDAAQEVMADQPAWAIEKACLAIRRRGYSVRDPGGKVKLEQHWPPSDGDIHAAVEDELELRRAALASAEALLAAPVEPAAAVKEAALVEQSLAEYHARVAQGTLNESEHEARRRDLILKQTKQRNLEDRLREYADAGLEPPVPRNGIVTSLPMMLKAGYTIQGLPGQRVLVAPLPNDSPAIARETRPDEMGR